MSLTHPAVRKPLSLFAEFREFIARGNVVDLAVGVIIGAAFGKIVTAFVDQVIMPPIGLALGRVDFSELKIVLQHADPARKLAAVSINYGVFFNALIQFLIIALVVFFFLVKGVNVLRRREAESPLTPPAPTKTESLLMEIRDLLAARPSSFSRGEKEGPAPS